MRRIYVEPIKVNKNKIRKSYKFKGAYQIEGREGHYFLKDWRPYDNSRVIVPWMFYEGRWHRYWVYFDKRSFEKLLANL